MLQQDEIDAIVGQLDEARRGRVPLRPLGASHPGLAIDDAYAIQESWNRLRIAGGCRAAGYKLGLTTHATQQALGIDRPIYGVLFADARMEDGGTVPARELIAPRVEPELAFVMRAPLSGECSAAEALEAIACAAPALEIIDNRIIAADAGTQVRRNALDIIADAGGAAAYVISREHFDPREVDLAAIETVLKSGEGRQTGRFADVFGSPENALVELARELARRGGAIAEGDVVLTGSPLRPVAIAPGDRIEADFGNLGTLRITCG